MNDWNVVNPASRRDAQLFIMHTQAFLATPVETLPARCLMPSLEIRSRRSQSHRTLHKKASNSICLRLKLMLQTGTGFAIAIIGCAECENLVVMFEAKVERSL